MKVPKSATLNSSRLQQRKNLVSELQDENDDEDDSTKNEKRKKEKKSLADILSKPAPSFQWLFPSVGSQNKKSENIKDVGQPQQPIDQSPTSSFRLFEKNSPDILPSKEGNASRASDKTNFIKFNLTNKPDKNGADNEGVKVEEAATHEHVIQREKQQAVEDTENADSNPPDICVPEKALSGGTLLQRATQKGDPSSAFPTNTASSSMLSFLEGNARLGLITEAHRQAALSDWRKKSEKELQAKIRQNTNFREDGQVNDGEKDRNRRVENTILYDDDAMSIDVGEDEEFLDVDDQLAKEILADVDREEAEAIARKRARKAAKRLKKEKEAMEKSAKKGEIARGDLNKKQQKDKKSKKQNREKNDKIEEKRKKKKRKKEKRSRETDDNDNDDDEQKKVKRSGRNFSRSHSRSSSHSRSRRQSKSRSQSRSRTPSARRGRGRHGSGRTSRRRSSSSSRTYSRSRSPAPRSSRSPVRRRTPLSPLPPFSRQRAFETRRRLIEESWHRRIEDSVRPISRNKGSNFPRDISPIRKSSKEDSTGFSKADYMDEHGRIDKQKLREIATRNATKLAMEGKLPKGTELIETIKNKSVDQLIGLCKQLQKERDLLPRGSSSDEDEDRRYSRRYEDWADRRDRSRDREFRNRAVRPAPERHKVVERERKEQRARQEDHLRVAFPVSSGVKHRTKANEPIPEGLAGALVRYGQVGPLTTALSKVRTSIPAAYRPLSQPLAICAAPSGSLSTHFETKSDADVGIHRPPSPPPEKERPPPSIVSSKAYEIALAAAARTAELEKEKTKVPMMATSAAFVGPMKPELTAMEVIAAATVCSLQKAETAAAAAEAAAAETTTMATTTTASNIPNRAATASTTETPSPIVPPHYQQQQPSTSATATTTATSAAATTLATVAITLALAASIPQESPQQQQPATIATPQPVPAVPAPFPLPFFNTSPTIVPTSAALAAAAASQMPAKQSFTSSWDKPGHIAAREAFLQKIAEQKRQAEAAAALEAKARALVEEAQRERQAENEKVATAVRLSISQQQQRIVDTEQQQQQTEHTSSFTVNPEPSKVGIGGTTEIQIQSTSEGGQQPSTSSTSTNANTAATPTTVSVEKAVDELSKTAAELQQTKPALHARLNSTFVASCAPMLLPTTTSPGKNVDERKKTKKAATEASDATAEDGSSSESQQLELIDRMQAFVETQVARQKAESVLQATILSAQLHQRWQPSVPQNELAVFSASTSKTRDPIGLTKTPKTIQELVAERLRHNQRLQRDPNDFEARKALIRIEDEMSKWAQDSTLPGEFTGHTGARVLSEKELEPNDPRFHAWAKKDQFRNAPELSSGVGMRLLQKMGWKPGQGLGKDLAGPVEPLSLDIKSDKKGFYSEGFELMPKRESVLDSAGKNPVSVLMEVCSRNRWDHPEFYCVETGPHNNRRYHWKAVLNGVEYSPSLPSSNKKAGKAQVCMVMLESLGSSA